MHGPFIYQLLFSFCTDYAAALGPWARHLTEPDHRSSLIEFIQQPNDTSLIDDSCIFITPYISDFNQGSFGPQIFSSDGTLIWNGNYTARVRAMDAHVCDYMGGIGNHICYNDAQPVEQAGHSAGAIRFFDNTYTQVGPDYGAEGHLRAPDIHELNTPGGQNGETFIQDIYEIRKMDLSIYRGPEIGYVLDGCFQEIEVRTKNVLFEWCALDHLPIWDTYIYLYGVESPNYTIPITGNGEFDAPWDFFHINAIARNLEGDYAISARHMDTIFKIAGNSNGHGVAPGTILWRLGGKNNDFKMDFNFSRQHTVRFHSIGPSSSVISLFDNAYDGWARTSKWSSGKMIHIDNSTMTASLIAQYDDPEQEVSFSQGSTQLLRNGNVLVGWGNRATFSEFSYDGQLLSHGNYSGGVESFRVWKFPWKGFPTHPPKILAFAQSCNASLFAYASWNGATEIQAWRFYASWGTQYGPWHLMGTIPKQGFETFANFTDLHENAMYRSGRPKYTHYAPYMYASALDGSGRILGSSNVAHTFVPKNETVARLFNCTTHLCEDEFFRFEETWSCGATCARDHTAAAWVVVGLICFIEFAASCSERFGRRYLSGHARRPSSLGFYQDHEYDPDGEGDDDFEEKHDEDDWEADWESGSQTGSAPTYDPIQVGKRRDHLGEKGISMNGYRGGIATSARDAYLDGASDDSASLSSAQRPRSLTNGDSPRTFIGSGLRHGREATRGSLANGLENLLLLFGLGGGNSQPSSASTATSRGRASTNVPMPVRVSTADADDRLSRSTSGSHRRVISERSVGFGTSAPPTASPPGAPAAQGRVRASGLNL